MEHRCPERGQEKIIDTRWSWGKGDGHERFLSNDDYRRFFLHSLVKARLDHYTRRTGRTTGSTALLARRFPPVQIPNPVPSFRHHRCTSRTTAASSSRKARCNPAMMSERWDGMRDQNRREASDKQSGRAGCPVSSRHCHAQPEVDALSDGRGDEGEVGRYRKVGNRLPAF